MSVKRLEEVELLLHVCLENNPMFPLNEVNGYFEGLFGFAIPFGEFGFPNVKSFFESLSNLYITEDLDGKECVLYHHGGSEAKIMSDGGTCEYNSESESSEEWAEEKKETLATPRKVYEDAFLKLKMLMPLFFDHQALGDDFFVDLAETKFQYHIPPTGNIECGLCSVGQTVRELTEKVEKTPILAPKVVLMIGMQDILNGRELIDIISDYDYLMCLLLSKEVRVTVLTLIKPLKVYYTRSLSKRIKQLNRRLLHFTELSLFDCKVIDMYKVFEERGMVKQNLCSFDCVDAYQMFSKTGKKVFLNTLKEELTKLI